MKRKVKRSYLVAMTFLVGMIVTLQIKGFNEGGQFVSERSIAEMKKEILSEKEENTNLTMLLGARKKELSQLHQKMKEGNIGDVLAEEHKKVTFLAADAGAKGPGVQIALRDSQRDLKEGQNPNDLVIHEQDVLNILNDLKASGSEAIAINGERLNTFTDIRCSGPTILVGQKTYGEPFLITALGDPDTLEGAVLSLDSSGYFLQSIYGIEVKVSKKRELYLAPARERRNCRYLEEEAS